MKWLAEGTDGKNPHTKEYVDPIIELSLEYLKDQGFTKIGALGYCFGAKVGLFPYRRRGCDAPLLDSLANHSAVRRPPLQERHQRRLRCPPFFCRGG